MGPLRLTPRIEELSQELLRDRPDPAQVSMYLREIRIRDIATDSINSAIPKALGAERVFVDLPSEKVMPPQGVDRTLALLSARFGPARMRGLFLAASMVWMVEGGPLRSTFGLGAPPDKGHTAEDRVKAILANDLSQGELPSGMQDVPHGPIDRALGLETEGDGLDLPRASVIVSVAVTYLALIHAGAKPNNAIGAIRHFRCHAQHYADDCGSTIPRSAIVEAMALSARAPSDEVGPVTMSLVRPVPVSAAALVSSPPRYRVDLGPAIAAMDPASRNWWLGITRVGQGPDLLEGPLARVASASVADKLAAPGRPVVLELIARSATASVLVDRKKPRGNLAAWEAPLPPANPPSARSRQRP